MSTPKWAADQLAKEEAEIDAEIEKELREEISARDRAMELLRQENARLKRDLEMSYPQQHEEIERLRKRLELPRQEDALEVERLRNESIDNDRLRIERACMIALLEGARVCFKMRDRSQNEEMTYKEICRILELARK